MQKNRTILLSTKNISDSLVATASLYNIKIDQIPFIKTEESIESAIEERIKIIGRESHFVVFTSSNAVRAVSELVKEKPAWKIYCIGPKTQMLVAEAFGVESIIGSGNNAKELCEKITSNSSIKKMIFFSGNQRRDELPEKLTEHGIKLEELVVYETIETPTSVSKNYDGILFFSPSAVRSFFSKNKINSEAALFAIGNTTTDEIKLFTNQTVNTPEIPSAEKMVCAAIQHFNKIKIS